ncbi:hypothetical protein Adu01nite_07680 [Paractinoplanes durhamensis]|uniref:G5 domain-containing protein n=3 Tax=Paractinoplanes durhamensis TaxID=113563 RepID=A0ABQ3YPA3_9ACTN|nr:hypothetical protein Adu01nite_07680 [Actinoplanes durhamensis]
MAAGTGALLIFVGGGVAGVAALTRDDGGKTQAVAEAGQAAAGSPARPSTGDGLAPIQREPVPGQAGAVEAQAQAHAKAQVQARAQARDIQPADRTATRDPASVAARPAPRAPGAAVPPRRAPTAPRAPGAPAAPAGPVTTVQTEVETREIPFETRLVRDPALPRGAKRIETPGLPGVETLRYQVTVVDGQTTDRQLIDATVTTQPQHRIVAFGTRLGMNHDRDSECGDALRLCVPLGRRAACPPEERAENAGVLNLGGSVTVADEDVAILNEIGELAC